MSVKRITIVAAAALALLGFTALAVYDVSNRETKLEFQEVKVQTKAAEVKELKLQYEQLNIRLEEAARDKNTSEAEAEQLRQEKQRLDAENQRLQAELQAKLERKRSIAEASEQVIATATQTRTASAAGGDIRSIIISAAAKYGVSADMMLRLAQCESTMGVHLTNPSPVIVNGVNYGHAAGVFQFIPSTWQRMSAQAGYGGADVYDTVANVNTAAWAFSTGHKGEWECQ